MIEFREKAEDTLRREIMEEIGEEIANIKLLNILENIFTYEGRQMHELVFIYDAEFVDKCIYEKDVIRITETCDVWCNAYWKSLDEFGDGKLKLYPDNLKELLVQLNK